VGGASISVSGVAQTNLARLNPDGSVDQSFASAVALAETSPVTQLLVQSHDRILLLSSGALYRLNAGGTLDETFDLPGLFPNCWPGLRTTASSELPRVRKGSSWAYALTVTRPSPKCPHLARLISWRATESRNKPQPSQLQPVAFQQSQAPTAQSTARLRSFQKPRVFHASYGSFLRAWVMSFVYCTVQDQFPAHFSVKARTWQTASRPLPQSR
jgi:Domain of unknown function (DUF5122) beta-propeller